MSPDGTTIAFSRLDAHYTWDVCLLRLAQLRVRCITRGRGNEREPAWSPDGERIVFSGDAQGGTLGRRTIYSIGADGSSLRALTSGAIDASGPSWDPHGSSLVYALRNVVRR